MRLPAPVRYAGTSGGVILIPAAYDTHLSFDVAHRMPTPAPTALPRCLPPSIINLGQGL